MKLFDSNNNKIDTTTGPITKKLVVFAIPLMFSSMLQLLFNTADIIVVGRFAGDTALAAVGSSSSAVALIIQVIIGLGIGVNVVVARAFGARDEHEISEAVHTAMALSLISAVVMAIIGCLTCDFVLEKMGTPESVFPLSEMYMYILFVGIPAMSIYNFGAAILRAKGDTKRPLIYLSIAGVLNVGLNMFFVIVLKMSVSGVALATVLSQCLSAFLVVRCLTRETDSFRLYLKKIHINGKMAYKMCVVGIPAGLQGMLFSLSNMVLQSAINSYGEIAMAGSSAASSLENFTYFAMNSFTQAGLTFTSQNMGAGKIERVPMVLKNVLLISVGVSMVMGWTTYLLCPWLLAIYTKSAAVVAAGKLRLFWICVPYFLCALMDAFPGIERGLGYSILPTIITLVGACGFRVVWINTVCKLPQCSSIDWVFAVYIVTWVLTTIAHLICYKLAMNRVRKKYSKKDALI